MGPRVRSRGLARPLALAAALLGACAPSAAAMAEAGERVTIVGVERGAGDVGDLPGERVARGVRVVEGVAPTRLRGEDGIRWAEPSRQYHAAALPDDPLFGQQWPLARSQGIGAAGAWWTTRGAGVTVAVLDSGIDLAHPDLQASLWRNSREIPGNGIDDDGNGYVDDLHGADVIDRTGDPIDRHGHGTAMAGAIAATGGNGIGIRGVAPRATIMPVKVLDDNGAGTTETLVAGIAYAVASGARVINLSVNGPDHSTALDEAIAAAEAAGVAVVTSAGNDSANRVAVPSYPASSTAANLITVAAGSQDGGIIASSAWGRDVVDLAAPGDGVLSTARGGGYAPTSGTSVAAAHVSGAVALLAAAKPGAPVSELRGALLGGAHPLRRDGWRVGAGGLDAAGAVARLAPSSRPQLRLRARVGRLGRRGRVALRWGASGPVGAVASYRVRLDGRLFVTSSTSGRAAGTRRSMRLRPGLHTLRVTALDASERPLATRTFRPRVARPRHPQPWAAPRRWPRIAAEQASVR